MPIGSYAAAPYLAQQLIRSRPKRVLDLGMGFGGNAAVVRQWLDLGVQPWQTFLVGVEAWANYRNPLWDLYNLVVLDNIERFGSRCRDQFDCVLLTEVIEHFSLAEGKEVIRLFQQCVARDGLLLVSTPAAFIEQGACYGNPYECHRSLWTVDDFAQLGFETQIVGQDDWYCGRSIIAVWKG
jgi:hypothetical protein